MSNNLVSQPLLIPNKQMDPIPNKLEVPIPDMRTGVMGGISRSPRIQQFDASHKQMGLVQPMPNNFGYYDESISNRHLGQKEQQTCELGLPQYIMPNQHDVGDMKGMLSNHDSPKLSLPSKRTAAGEPILGNSVGQKFTTLNQNIAQIEAFTNCPGMQQQSSKPASNKKMVRNESISGRSASKQLQTPKSRTMQMEPSPKSQGESFESVRSKMRESLASALALVSQQQGKASKDATHISGDISGSSELKESCAAYKAFDGQSTSQPNLRDDGIGDPAQRRKDNEPEFQYGTVLSSEEAPFTDSFFVQDELLQGNGLTWAMELDVDKEATKEVETDKKPKLVDEDVSGEGKALQSPQNLASKIEAELFNFFGGVNKKYKEKGRSLLFNLKDRNNPELRERVMSGEIPPERLCSMSAEELASKELSEWRVAKAEELAQMVILPDSDVEVRRLVKKTHKGEFQVEVQEFDGVSVEVSMGTSAFARLKSENKDTEPHPSPEVDELNEKECVVGEKSSSGNQDLSCSLTIPNDVTDSDLMQGLMADEFKDAEFLPPIVSLDEFMQSLDSEPPFEKLHVDGGKTLSPSSKESAEGRDQVTPHVASKEPLHTTAEKSDKVDIKYVDSDVKIKPRESPVQEKLSPTGAAFKGERVWEGVLQLNVSAGVNAVGFFRSGDKTSTKEWPSSLEIKGRVKLDAFEKFIQELPMSRSRAVMVVHFVLKEGSSDADHASLGEAVHSYVLDERLGYAEPAPGVELYFCPPHPKLLETLGKHLPKSHTQILNTIEKGLIGVTVWRRVHISSSSAVISPNHSSHNKHTSSKKPTHHLTWTTSMSKRQEQNDNKNVNFTPQQRVPPVVAPPHPLSTEEDDDIPPGFGPAPPVRTRDEDDLPEFNFSGVVPTMPKQNISNSFQTDGQPVDQMRELVQKYGQSENNNKLWNNNDDDEDDIPEWQPHNEALTMHHPNLQRAMPQRQHPPWVPLQQQQLPPANNMTAQGGRWVNQLPGPQPQLRHPYNHPSFSTNLGGSQLYGAHRFPRTRGF